MSKELAYAYESGYQDGLRCAEIENAELREQIHWLKQGDILHVLTDQELADQQKHEREVQASIIALDDDNAKLRKESDKYHDLYVHAIADAEVWHLQWSAEHQENAKLREELAQWERLTAGIELPDYPISQFQPKDLERENAKLRELVTWMYCLMDESCAVQHPYAPEPIRYDTLLDVYEKLRELGMEVTNGTV